jgi:hypothetical protein
MNEPLRPFRGLHATALHQSRSNSAIPARFSLARLHHLCIYHYGVNVNERVTRRLGALPGATLAELLRRCRLLLTAGV